SSAEMAMAPSEHTSESRRAVPTVEVVRSSTTWLHGAFQSSPASGSTTKPSARANGTASARGGHRLVAPTSLGRFKTAAGFTTGAASRRGQESEARKRGLPGGRLHVGHECLGNRLVGAALQHADRVHGEDVLRR